MENLRRQIERAAEKYREVRTCLNLFLSFWNMASPKRLSASTKLCVLPPPLHRLSFSFVPSAPIWRRGCTTSQGRRCRTASTTTTPPLRAAYPGSKSAGSLVLKSFPTVLG